MILRDLSVVWLSGLATIAATQDSTPPPSVPTTVGPLHRDGNFISFTHSDHPGNRIGYRFHEHIPFVWGDVPTAANDGDSAATARLEAEFAGRSGVFVHRVEVRHEGWCPQDWTYYIVPVADGFDLLWAVEPLEDGLNEYYAAQQCFRMSGVTNQEWRRAIAETPAFSEFDHWADEEAKGEGLSSLAHVRVGGDWRQIPATRDHLGYRTKAGLDMDEKRTDGDIDAASLEPYGPTTFHGTADCGLATRTDAAGEWVCGLFWERTTHITDHHPADCLHAVVNLGPIAPGGKRAIRGKIYWTKATLDELYKKWRQDFPDGGM